MANSFILGGMPVNLGELVAMDYSHEKIHDGEMFAAHYYGGTLAVSGTMLLTIFAGTITPHLLVHASVGGDARMRVTEGGALTGGTAVTVFNMNRTNAGSCLSTVKHTGALAGGTVINDIYVPGGAGPQAAGGGARANHEFVIRPGTTTTVEIVNLTTAYPASVGFVWYEENE